MWAVVIPAATDDDHVLGADRRADLGEQGVDVLRFDGQDDDAGPRATAATGSRSATP